jgi:hypothetical protein
LAINHPPDLVKSLDEEFLLLGQFPLRVYNDALNRWETHWEWHVLERIPLHRAQAQGGYAVLHVGLKWEQGREPRFLRLDCATRNHGGYDTKWGGSRPVTPPFPLGFQKIAWDAESRTAQALADEAKQGKFFTSSPFSSLGRWQVAHAFTPDLDPFSTIYLWHVEIPAHIEIHSHIQSNHCSTLPAAWVHVWEATLEWHAIQPGYEWQDKLAPLAMGEGAEVGTQPTAENAARFGLELSEGDFEAVFPFLKREPDKIGCLMPMDMDYMHFNGYFGIPISQVFASVETATGETKNVRWFCWDKMWEFETNNHPRATGRGQSQIPAKYKATPPSSKEGEVWNWMETSDARAFEKWKDQYAGHVAAERSGTRGSIQPFFHFDPRRYTQQAVERGNEGYTLEQALQQPLQTGGSHFFGFKLYTAMGWAPLDPFLRETLEPFYSLAESTQTPLMNHGTPAGYYSHDRRHYFDRLSEHGKVCEGKENEVVHKNAADKLGWFDRFARTVPGPDDRSVTPSRSKNEHWWSQREEERIWWFTHHYVSAQSWNPVLERFPKLKLCLAHFGDSAHLRDDSWDVRKSREPRDHFRGWRDSKRNLTFATNGATLDSDRTHRFLYDLLELIKPTNRVFVDLSYVILDEHNADKFCELFEWAREHKPILLERVLWGTDWPLIGNEAPVTGGKKGGGNMLHRYAKGFRDAIPGMPPDFFVRACFLNPLQYLDLAGIRKALKPKEGSAPWPWVDGLPPQVFNAEFTGDKAELFYKECSLLAKRMGP